MTGLEDLLTVMRPGMLEGQAFWTVVGITEHFKQVMADPAISQDDLKQIIAIMFGSLLARTLYLEVAIARIQMNDPAVMAGMLAQSVMAQAKARKPKEG